MGDVFKSAQGVIGQYDIGYKAMNPDQPPTLQANIPKFGMRKTTDFYQNNPNIQISNEGVGAPGAAQRRYAGLREQSSNRINADLGGNVNAIQRRFSAMGASGSGAQVAAEMQAHDAAAHQKEDANIGIDQQENQAVDTEQNRFMQKNISQADMDFKNRLFSFDQASKMHELDLAERKQQTDSAIEEFNGQVAAQAARPQKKGFVSNLIGGIF